MLGASADLENDKADRRDQPGAEADVASDGSKSLAAAADTHSSSYNNASTLAHKDAVQQIAIQQRQRSPYSTQHFQASQMQAQLHQQTECQRHKSGLALPSNDATRVRASDAPPDFAAQGAATRAMVPVREGGIPTSEGSSLLQRLPMVDMLLGLPSGRAASDDTAPVSSRSPGAAQTAATSYPAHASSSTPVGIRPDTQSELASEPKSHLTGHGLAHSADQGVHAHPHVASGVQQRMAPEPATGQSRDATAGQGSSHLGSGHRDGRADPRFVPQYVSYWGDYTQIRDTLPVSTNLASAMSRKAPANHPMAHLMIDNHLEVTRIQTHAVARGVGKFIGLMRACDLLDRNLSDTSHTVRSSRKGIHALQRAMIGEDSAPVVNAENIRKVAEEVVTLRAAGQRDQERIARLEAQNRQLAVALHRLLEGRSSGSVDNSGQAHVPNPPTPPLSDRAITAAREASITAAPDTRFDAVEHEGSASRLVTSSPLDSARNDEDRDERESSAADNEDNVALSSKTSPLSSVAEDANARSPRLKSEADIVDDAQDEESNAEQRGKRKRRLQRPSPAHSHHSDANPAPRKLRRATPHPIIIDDSDEDG